MSSAAAFVPENEDLRVLATFFEGIVLLRQDQNAAALKKLERYRNRLPVAYDVESLIVQAQMGVAFDAKDYDGFLSGAQALHQRRPQDATSQATLASAWACKYAVTGETTFQDQALLCLKQAEDMAQGNPDFKEYGERIRYRLATREIIDRKEFQKRFPNGWNGQKEE